MSFFAVLAAFDFALAIVKAATLCSPQPSFSSLRPLRLSFFKTGLYLLASPQMS